MQQPTEQLTADRKALIINLDERFYGTFAEIGAGQEVARHFFRVGGASGTVAKTMSAYDMKFSDEIYGKVGRYVSRERLNTMLDHEFELLIQRLGPTRGDNSCFFVFANTVAVRNFKGTNDSHGWMGIRFQSRPHEAANDIVVHVRMTDKEAVLQQQALGVIGVNLIFGAFYFAEDPDLTLQSLLDELSLDRIEVDMVAFSGPVFRDIDNRVMSLKLVQNKLTDAAMFGPDGSVLQPSEIFYKKAVLIQRGSFRPVTLVATDMLQSARELFQKEPEVAALQQEGKYVEVLEITLNNLLSTGGQVDADFLARADVLSTLGFPVLISNYPEYYRLVAYLRRYTNEMLALTLGVNTLLEVFNQKYYANLPGGILEALGRIFKHGVKLYAYPTTRDSYLKYRSSHELPVDRSIDPSDTDAPIITARNMRIPSHFRHLYLHLLESGYVQSVASFHEEYLSISAGDVLKMISENDPRWFTMVPEPAAKLIRERKLWGCSI